jgi:uncharacterized delta-60 repeat protein
MLARTRSQSRRPLEPLESRLLFIAGDLDPAFGTGGIAIADFGVAGVQGIDVAASGARIYAAGILPAPGAQEGRVAIAAFDRFGRPDPGVGGDGTVVTDLTLPTGYEGKLLVQSDGKLLVLNGIPSFGRQAHGLARFNPDGTVDRTFGGGDGKSELAIGAAMALAPGGKIVVCGNGPYDAVRLNPDGSFDPTFDDDGTVDLNFFGSNDSGQSGAVDVAVMDDGRIVLVGADDDPDPAEGWVAAAARLNPDGSFDNTFGTNGRVLTGFGHFDNGYTAAAAGPNGEVLFATMEGEVHARPQVITGSVTIPQGTFFTRMTYRLPTITRMHVQKDGKVVVSGTVSESLYDDGSPETLLARYNPDGTLDPTFAQGRVMRPTSDRTALTPEGDVVALAGSGPNVPLSAITEVAVARYLGHDADSRTSLIPAEAPLSTNGAVVAGSHPGYTGSGYVDFIRDSGGRATYEFYAHQTGDYELRIRYANGTHRARILSVGHQYSRDATVAFLPTGSWSRWREARVTIRRVVHSPRFSERTTLQFETLGGNGPNIDKVTIVRPNMPVKIQAEDATLGGAAALSQHAGFEGRGYADYIDADSYVEWEFISPVQQTLALSVRYANGTATARPLKLVLNGGPTGYFVFRPTGSWSTWRTDTIYLEVAAGANRLRLATGADGVGPNLDWLRVG